MRGEEDRGIMGEPAQEEETGVPVVGGGGEGKYEEELEIVRRRSGNQFSVCGARRHQ